jgi:hypothetical protein
LCGFSFFHATCAVHVLRAKAADGGQR